MSSARFLRGDVLEVLATLDTNSVDLAFSSPPFLALRSYLPADHPDKAKEIGSEATPADFLDTLLDVVEACDRVLAPHGSLVFELGDTYSGSGGAGGDYKEGGWREGQDDFAGSAFKMREDTKYRKVQDGTGRPPINNLHGKVQGGGAGWPLAKSLTGIPTLFAWSLAYGRNLLRPERETEPWRIRNVVAWVRPNPPVGALGDKFRPATSYLTVATKSASRWFDLDAVRTEPVTHLKDANGNNTKGADAQSHRFDKRVNSNPAGAPPLDWWKITTAGYSGSHYAVFPPELCRIPIESTCPRRVCVTCGEPSRREVDTDSGTGGRYVATTKVGGTREPGTGDRGGSSFTTTTTTTTGWTTCGCAGTDGIRLDGYHTGDGWRPGVVLDPFVGSGTTLVAATGLGRSAIGIDLDERNIDLARERVGMFLEVS